MVAVRKRLRFVLNDAPVETDQVKPETTLLDFLRLERRLTGSKEGCAEGDCGACTVLVGRLIGTRLTYKTVNSCICLLGSLDGTHVVTVEHLHAKNGGLHPVQQAMVDFHGSQCGFCTPGIVMSLYALWMNDPAPDHGAVQKALQGNLCRCTGYAPIVKAGLARAEYWDDAVDPLIAERDEILDRLRGWFDGARVMVGEGRGQIIVPADLDDLAAVLEQNPDARIVGGATDVGLWVTKFMRKLGVTVFTGHIADFHAIESDAELNGVLGVKFFGGASYSDARGVIESKFACLIDLWDRIGGEQVRNVGTIGGNIANGSPIGDTPPPFIAMGAKLCLRKGNKRRVIDLEDFFVDYGKQDRHPGEFVEWVFLPYPAKDDQVGVYKISKRRDEDISSLCGAFSVRLEDGIVRAVRIAYGGMAATPKRAGNVEAALIGQAWSERTIMAAQKAISADFQPISDMRASADYRLLAAKNLLMRFYLETQGEKARLFVGAEK